jgi:hypothetical protein
MAYTPLGWRLRSAGCLALAIGWSLAADNAALAQTSTSSRGTTTAGMFGSRTLGGSTSSNLQRTSGTTTAGGTTGFGTSMGLGAGATMGMAGQSAGGAGMAMPLQQQGGFVGASSANVTNFMSRAGTTGTGGFGGARGATGLGGLTGLRNLFSQQGRGGFNSQAMQQFQRGGSRGGQGQTQLRTPLRVGFEAPTMAPPAFAAGFTQRLTKVPGLNRAGRIAVEMEGRTAVLRGTVPSDSDRELAERLALLEPEVVAVRNELVVGTPPSPAQAEVVTPLTLGSP